MSFFLYFTGSAAAAGVCVGLFYSHCGDSTTIWSGQSRVLTTPNIIIKGSDFLDLVKIRVKGWIHSNVYILHWVFAYVDIGHRKEKLLVSMEVFYGGDFPFNSDSRVCLCM